MKGSDLIAQAIKEESGVVFGLPGESIISLYESLADLDVENVLMRDERSAVHAADGFAKVSGKVGACMGTHGPGIMNMALGIATAYRDSVPLAIISGQVATDRLGQGVFQELDSYHVLRPITKMSKRAHDLAFDISTAFWTAKEGRPGPVHLEVPVDIMGDDWGDYSHKEVVHPAPDEKDIDLLLSLLNEAIRPVVLAGGGATSYGEELKLFIEAANIPLITTMVGRGIIPEDHPLCLGPTGTRGTKTANHAVKNSDLIISLGAGMSDRTTRHVPKGVPVFTINLDDKIQNTYKSTSDSGEFLKSLNKRIKKTKFKSDLNLIEKSRSKGDYDYNGKKGTCYEAVKEIYRVLDDETVVLDPGQYTAWSLILKKLSRPGEIIFSGSFAPMGYALPAAIGAHYAGAHPVVFTGDGSLAFSSHELATLKENQLPIVICLMNNREYGVIRQRQEDLGKARDHVDLDYPDFVKLAASYGIEASSILPHEVKDVLPDALKSGEPYLLEIMVEKEQVPMPK